MREGRQMRFRPCIDLHQGKVKQIVGSTLGAKSEDLKTNFETSKGSGYFADLYREDRLPGGHVIMLGPNCEEAALEALKAFPGGMHVGGGVSPSNATKYLDAGASHIIVTSYVFRNGQISWDRLEELVSVVGKERLVLDLSCRRLPEAQRGEDEQYYVVTDKWQKYTTFALTAESLKQLASYCDEFLVHGVDVEGMQCGILDDLVSFLGEHSPIPVTYAGGARSVADLDRVRSLGNGRVDLTIGSALDIFGGDLAYTSVVQWQRKVEEKQKGDEST
jgi:phosphoribosylformimino-5-aminoimidazole carboxamide ribotide isomerase